MAHFYGLVVGNRGEATRMGSKQSGMRAWAQTWDGRVTVDLDHVNANSGFEERDQARIRIGKSGDIGTLLQFDIENLADFVRVLSDANNTEARALVEQIEGQFRKLNEKVAVAALGDKIMEGKA